MSERLIKNVIVERTRAQVLFDDGRTQEFTSEWGDSKEGRGYDGGHWGPFPNFRDQLEKKIALAQNTWGLPTATIRYYRETRTTATVERRTETQQFYCERTAVHS